MLRAAGITGLSTRVHSSLPREPTFPLALVKRIGGVGPAKQRLDAPNIQVEVWNDPAGGGKATAYDIAATARKTIHDAEGSRVSWSGGTAYLGGVTDALGVTWAPDPVSDRDRYIFGVQITTHV